MRVLLSVVSLLFLIFPIAVQAQLQASGTLADAVSGLALSGVTITASNSGAVTYSDNQGHYRLYVAMGETLRFQLQGYKSKALVVSSDAAQKILLEKNTIIIDTVTISGLTPYQRDSIARRMAYARELEKKPAKARIPRRNKYGSEGPGAGTFRVEAPVSGLVQKKTRKYKRLKAFQDRFRKDEEQLFIDTRYTPLLVQELTGLSGDTLIAFMNRYPMPIAYARTASDLEIGMWIRNNYKEWRKAGH